MLKAKIKCDICGENYEYEEMDMPDGYLTNGKWICDACGSCPNCGRSLEDEEWKRGVVAKPCRYCEECEFGGDIKNDCDGCAYSIEYHYFNGECIKRGTEHEPQH